MILCRCVCGEAYRVGDEEAGSEVECPTCGQRFTVPVESAPDLCLVLVPGQNDESEGMPLSEARLVDELVNGAWSSGARVWQGGRWQTTSEWLAARPPATLAAGGAEPATTPAPRQALKLRQAAVLQDEAAAADAGGAQAVEARTAPVPRRSRLRSLARAAFAVAVLAMGYRFGFGPLIFSALKRPAVVIVKSGGQTHYDATLGWRRLTQELPAGSACRFQVYVGMPERQNLVLTPVPEGAGTAERYTLRLFPGACVLVNVRQESALTELDEAAVSGRRVDAELQALVLQLEAHDAPVAAVAVVRALQGIGQTAVRRRFNDAVVDLTRYRMDEYLGFGTGTGPDPTLPRLTTLPSYPVAFGNGRIQVTFAEPERQMEATLEMPAATVRLVPEVELAVPARCPLQVTRVGDRLNLHLRVSNQALRARRGTFPGNWEYRASGTGSDPSQWSWTWLFRGEGTVEGQHVRMECVWKQHDIPVLKTEPIKR